MSAHDAGEQKSPEEIEALKRQWRADPCWDIEETPGFEAHREALRAYREEMSDAWHASARADLEAFAVKIGLSDNLLLAAFLRDLDRRMTTLERRSPDVPRRVID